MSQNKGGRPRLHHEKRKRRTVFFSDTEWEKLASRMALFGYSNHGDFIREKLAEFNPRLEVVDELKRIQMERLYVELSRIGNNINQIAKAVNQGDESALANLSEMKQAIDGLRVWVHQ